MTNLIAEDVVAHDNERLRGASIDQLRQWMTDVIYLAFAEARRNKRNTVNEQRFEEERELNLIRLIDDILERVYHPSRSVAFVITEPTPREIFAASFRDRVVHHFLILLVGHFWDKRLSPRSFSCRRGKGTLYGIERLYRDMQSMTYNWQRDAWVMKLDLQGYFMSLPRDYLYDRVCWGLDRQFIDGGPIYDVCKYLWREILYDDPLDGVRLKGRMSDWSILPPSKSMFNSAPGRGIVIGNLTSQWVSNMALDPIDRYIIFELGHKYYGRYVDDLYFVAETLEDILHLRTLITERVESLGLIVHPRKQHIQLARHGVAFLGVVLYPGRIVIGRRSRRNMRQLRKMVERDGLTSQLSESAAAYEGIFEHINHVRIIDDDLGQDLRRELAKWH